MQWDFRKDGADTSDSESCIVIQVESSRRRKWEWAAYAIDSPAKHRLLAKSDKPLPTRTS